MFRKMFRKMLRKMLKEMLKRVLKVVKEGCVAHRATPFNHLVSITQVLISCIHAVCRVV